MVNAMKSFSESYKQAGVDITAGYQSVELMKSHIARTMTPGALSGIGGFGGLFPAGSGGDERTCAGQRHRRRRHQAENRHVARPS